MREFEADHPTFEPVLPDDYFSQDPEIAIPRRELSFMTDNLRDHLAQLAIHAREHPRLTLEEQKFLGSLIANEGFYYQGVCYKKGTESNNPQIPFTERAYSDVSKNAQQKLINSALPLAHWMVRETYGLHKRKNIRSKSQATDKPRKAFHPVIRVLDYDERLSAAYEGLTRAAAAYDGTIGFSTVSIAYIKRQLEKDALYKKYGDMLSLGEASEVEKLLYYIEDQQNQGKTPDLQQARLALNNAKNPEALLYGSLVALTSSLEGLEEIERKLHDDSELSDADLVLLSERVADHTASLASAQVLTACTVEALLNNTKLTDKQRSMFVLYYLHPYQLTFRDIGAIYGVTGSSVSQKANRVMEKLLETALKLGVDTTSYDLFSASTVPTMNREASLRAGTAYVPVHFTRQPKTSSVAEEGPESDPAPEERFEYIEDWKLPDETSLPGQEYGEFLRESSLQSSEITGEEAGIFERIPEDTDTKDAVTSKYEEPTRNVLKRLRDWLKRSN